VANDHFDVVDLLLTRGANANEQTASKSTNLHVAVQNRHDAIVQRLLDAGAEVNTTNEAGFTALSLCRTPKLLTTLISHGADVNHASRDRWVPLNVLLEVSDPELVRIIMDHGASFESTRKNGRAPIFSAVHAHGIDMLQLAVTYGARLDAQNERGDTLLDYAIQKENKEAISFLFERGARFVEVSDLDLDLDATMTEQLASELKKTLPLAMAGEDKKLEVELAMAQKTNIPIIMANALHAAIIGQSTSTVDMLLIRGAAVNAVNTTGRSPLHRAASVPKGEGLVELLLNHGAALQARDSRGAEPLHRATQMGRRCGKTVELLIDRIARLPPRDYLDDDTDSPTDADLAAQTRHTKLQEKLTGTWKGTYTYVTYHAGDEEPTEIVLHFHEDAEHMASLESTEIVTIPNISSRFFSGSGSDVWGSYDIYGQSIATAKECKVWYVKLYDQYGWLYEGTVDAAPGATDGAASKTLLQMVGNWGVSRLLWNGSFRFVKVDTEKVGDGAEHDSAH
jgi:ankyrin repeat protein